jgi:hypothetical protein
MRAAATDLAGNTNTVKESMLVEDVYDLHNMDTNLSGRIAGYSRYQGSGA